ncbi:hypothetical protein AGMMS49921_06410 [Endomicrobiia bacterium]|nr:hypothetical protein AGMMS49921_06410 [Endomicrobiia bacterium]
MKEAKEKFKEAKCLYGNKEYFRATDVLSCIALLYPKYEPSRHFYKEIAKI